MQVRNLRNRLRVNMVCEWAWVSNPGERDLPESLKLVLSLGAQFTRTGTYARTHTYRQVRARILYYHGTQTKTKVDVQ